MIPEWYYNSNGTEHGPISGAELKALAQSGELKPTDLIWKEGMQTRKLAGKLKGLFSEPTQINGPSSITQATPETAKSADQSVGQEGFFGKIKAAAQQVQSTLQDPKVTEKLLDKAKKISESAGEKAKAAVTNVQTQIDKAAKAAADSAGGPEKHDEQPLPSIKPSVSKKALIVAGMTGLVLVLCVIVILLASGHFGGGSSSYPNLDAMTRDFDAVYLIEPRQLVTKFKGGIGIEDSSFIGFRGGKNGIKRIAVAKRNNSSVLMYVEEDSGRLVELTKDSLFDTSSVVYRGESGIDYSFKSGIVSGSWRYKWSLFVQQPGATTSDHFAFKLVEQKRYRPK